jgi:hypothetical protein
MISKCFDCPTDLADKCRLGSSWSEILVSEDTAPPQLPKTSIILSTHFPVIYTPVLLQYTTLQPKHFFSLRLLAPQTLCILPPPHPLKYYPLSYENTKIQIVYILSDPPETAMRRRYLAKEKNFS